ncbi:MAG: PAS domain S-box protein [Acidobacteria bacterium]|nr:PAS domain S-box protein [Acidobacteriota bacterium]
MSNQSSRERHVLEQDPLSLAILNQAAFFSGSPVPIVVIDLAGRVVALNPAAEQFLGCSIPEIKDRAYPFVKPEDLDAHALLLKRIAAGELIPKHIAFRVDTDGNSLQVEVTLSTITSGTEVAGIVEFLNPVAADSQLTMLMGAVEALPHGTIICDATLPDLPIIYANPAFVKLTGYAREEILGRNCRFLQGPHTDQATVAVLRQAIAEYRQFEGELLNYRKDGTWFWNRLTVAPVTNQRGKPTYFVGVQTDVTDRKAVELKLRQKEQLFEHGPAVIFRWEVNAPYRTLAISANIKQFGYDPDAFLCGNITWVDLIHPGDQARVQAEVLNQQQLQPLPKFTEQRYRIVCADSSIKWVYAHFVPVPDNTGAMVAVDGYLLDITHRKQAEDALRESENRLRRIGDNLPDGALYQMVTSPERNRKYTYVSAGAERILGYPIEAILADADLVYKSVLEEDMPALLAAESKAWDELSIFNHTVRVCTTTGELKWIHCQSSPRLDPDGSVVWDGVVIDVTQSRYAEESLKRSERFLNAVFENSPVGLEVFSLDGWSLRLNTAMARFLGYADSRTAAIDKFNVLTDPLTLALGLPDHFNRALQGEIVELGSQILDLTVFQAQAVQPSIIYYDSAFVPIADEFGKIINIMFMVWDTTAQKEAERALRQKEQLLRQAAKIAKVGGWAIELKIQKLFWSEETYRIHEVDPQYEPDVESAINFYAPEARPVIQSAVEKGIRDGEGFDLELPFITARGKQLWVRALGEAEFEKDECVRLAGAFQDITEQKITELALKESEERFREIVNTLPQMVGVIDRELHFQFINNTYLEFFQLERPQIIGKSVLEIIGPQAFTQFSPLIERALNGESVHFCQQMFYSHAAPYLDGYLIPHRSAGGEIIGYLTVKTDVTRVKEAEIALRENAETYQSLLNTTMDGFCLINDEGKFVEVNEVYCQMLGYSRAELFTKRICDLDVQNTNGELAARLQKIVERGSDQFETLNCTADGRIITVEVSCTYLANKRQILVFTRDITARKQAEEQLRQAQKMEAVGRMAGGIAHDFNNVLTIIMGYINILQQRLLPDHTCSPVIEQLLKASERGSALAKQLLIFSRKQKVKCNPINLNDSITTMKELLHHLVNDGQELMFLTDPELGMICADASQLEQIILNLTVNARDAMPNGGRLIIETSNVELDEEFTQFHPKIRPGPYVLLGVTDTGVGMDDQTKACIFEPFFTTKEMGRGTGLGLAIVYGIVQSCGGYIVVDSMIGVGTSFSIYFPRIQNGMLIKRSTAPKRVAQKQNKVILLVEDDFEIRQMLTRMLKENEYNLLVAENGFEALQVATDYGEPIHLVVTDVRMPKMDGIELVNVLAPHHPEMKILYISGYVDARLPKTETLTHSHFLEKPFPPDLFLDKVRELLGDRVTE